MKWLLESEVFQDEDDTLIEALYNLGIDHVVTKFGTSYEQYMTDLKSEDVIFHGSLQFAKKALKQTNWRGVLCNLPQFECLYYYPRFGKYLLNSEYIMLPFGELDRRKNWLLQKVGEDGHFFVRPSSGYKTFTGKLVNVKNWEQEKYTFGLRVDPEALVIVSRPYNIKSEWRTVVANGKIEAASQYKEGTEICKDCDVPEKVHAYGKIVLDSVEYNPDPIWIMDLCQTVDGEMKVLEVGSFSCSGFYSCDPYSIINVVGKFLSSND